NHLHEYWGYYTWVLAVVALLVGVRTQLYPSWKLLRHSLPRHGSKSPSRQASVTLLELLWRGLQVRSLYKAARVRVEIELLNHSPEQQLRLEFQNDHDYDAALQEWKAEKDKWKDQVNNRLAAISKEEEKDWTIEIENCSALLNNDDIPRYFDA